jgi:stearoyl-CoA desaturase (delta-9 desaturase)
VPGQTTTLPRPAHRSDPPKSGSPKFEPPRDAQQHDKEAAATVSAVVSSKAADREAIFAAMHPSQLRWDNIDWVTTTWTVVMHAGAIAAPFFFTWSALGVCIFLHWLTCSIGVCLGYHRYLSHKSMKLRPPAEFFTMLCGMLSAEGTP